MNSGTITVILTADGPDLGNADATGQIIGQYRDARRWDAHDGRGVLWTFTIDPDLTMGLKEQLRIMWAGHARVTWRHAGTVTETIVPSPSG